MFHHPLIPLKSYPPEAVRHFNVLHVDRLRSKLAHALVLLRMYHHKVQLLDTAASHLEAARPDANTAFQSQLTGEQSSVKDCVASESSSPAVLEGRGSDSGTQERSRDSADTASLQLYQDTAQHAGECSGQNQHKKPCSGQLFNNSSIDSKIEPNPPAMQKEGTCRTGQCSDSHTGAGNLTNFAAQGQDSPAALPATFSISSAALDPAITQSHVLRFDPTVGECGAFFIVRGGETWADGLIASPEGADAATGLRRSAGCRAEQLPAGKMADPLGTVLDDFEEAPRQVPALPQPYKGSRPDTGSSCGQRSAQNNPELVSSRNCCSSNKTEPSSCSSRDTASQRFEGSLMDLVAEVEQLLGDRSDSACYYGSSSSHSGAIPDIPAHAELTSPLQDGYCQQWIGKLVGMYSQALIW